MSKEIREPLNFSFIDETLGDFLYRLKKRKIVNLICDNYSLNLRVTGIFLKLKLSGFSDLQIAQKVGVHKITIKRTFDILYYKLKPEEFNEIYDFIIKNWDWI
jgi:hypothetical protein